MILVLVASGRVERKRLKNALVFSKSAIPEFIHQGLSRMCCMHISFSDETHIDV